jgi:archaellin
MTLKLKAFLLTAGIIFLKGGFDSASAVTFTTQDLYIIDSININSGGSKIDLSPQLITDSLSSVEEVVTFVGGATFSSTNLYDSQAVDFNDTPQILSNTTVIPGVLSFGGNQFFSILASSDIDQKAETIGESDSIEVDLTTVFPSGVNIGDTGRISYSLLQFTRPADSSLEVGLSSLETAVFRSTQGLGFFSFFGWCISCSSV